MGLELLFAEPKSSGLRFEFLLRHDNFCAHSFSVLIARFNVWAKLHRAPLTAKNYAGALEKFERFADSRGIFSPVEVDCDLIEEYLGVLRAQGNVAATVNHRLATLRTFWKRLRRWKVTQSNPPGDVDRLRMPRKLPTYLSIEDQEFILLSLAESRRNDRCIRDEAVIATALLTGLRCFELVGLRLEDVDLQRGMLRVQEGKGARDREVPIVGWLKDVLTIYRQARLRILGGKSCDSMFVGRRGESNCKAVYRIVHRHCLRILHREHSPHHMRHSFASRMREKGADLQLIQETLGHVNITSTTIYASLGTALRTATLEKILA